ncbi:DegT/DnrJ/EryC1/StrS family aminotransferase [Thermodesulfobacteriota bacterium]
MTTYPGMTQDILNALVRGKALEGDFIDRFEATVARAFCVKHAIALSSGRFGMQLILENLGLAAGDEIILPAYTQVELPAVIEASGFVPVLADVAPGAFNCSAEEISRKISGKTRVVIMTHMNGEAADVEGILKLADDQDLIVVEDNAHGIGVQAPDGRYLGSLGRAGFLSLETRKVVNTFGGGVVLTGDDDLARTIRACIAVLNPSFPKLFKRILSVQAEDLSLTAPLAPVVTRLLHSDNFNKAMILLYRSIHRSNRDARVAYSNLQALLGLRQMEHLEQIIRHRKELGRAYLEGLSGISDEILDQSYLNRLKRLTTSDSLVRHNFYAMIVLGGNTSRLANRLLTMGIDIGTGEDTCEDLPERYDTKGSYPNTRTAIEHGIQLPIYSTMTVKMVDKVCAAFRRL